MFDGVIVVLVPVHPQKGQSAADCERLSEVMGALSYDKFGTACWSVYGAAVDINPVNHDVEEGFRITNFNFNATGKMRSVSTESQLPGPKLELM